MNDGVLESSEHFVLDEVCDWDGSNVHLMMRRPNSSTLHLWAADSISVCLLFVCLFVAVCSSVLKCFHRFLHRRLNVVTIWDTSTFLMTMFERCNSHTSVALWLAGCGVPITRINTGDVCVFLQNHEHVVTLGLRLISPQSCRCWHISVSHRPTVCYLLFLATIIFFDTSVRTARIWK